MTFSEPTHLPPRAETHGVILPAGAFPAMAVAVALALVPSASANAFEGTFDFQLEGPGIDTAGKIHTRDEGDLRVDVSLVNPLSRRKIRNTLLVRAARPTSVAHLVPDLEAWEKHDLSSTSLKPTASDEPAGGPAKNESNEDNHKKHESRERAEHDERFSFAEVTEPKAMFLGYGVRVFKLTDSKSGWEYRVSVVEKLGSGQLIDGLLQKLRPKGGSLYSELAKRKVYGFPVQVEIFRPAGGSFRFRVTQITQQVRPKKMWAVPKHFQKMVVPGCPLHAATKPHARHQKDPLKKAFDSLGGLFR